VLVDLVSEDEHDGRLYRFFGIYAPNREEWVVASIASTHFSLVSVPLYDSLGTDAMEYILNQTGMRVVLCTAHNAVKLLAQRREGKAALLQTIIQFEPIAAEQREEASRLGLQLLDYAASLVQGRATQKPLRPPQPTDVYTLSYTSGTTGNPKGAILTHRAMVAALAGLRARFEVRSDDVHLSFLPLAHIYERLVHETFYYYGASIGFWRGDILTIRDDLALLKPTLLPGVPRLFSRFSDVIRGRFEEAKGLRRSLIHKAIASKLHRLRTESIYTHCFYDKLIFK
jgi:long-chain acyl-CoA synthetase